MRELKKLCSAENYLIQRALTKKVITTTFIRLEFLEQESYKTAEIRQWHL